MNFSPEEKAVLLRALSMYHNASYDYANYAAQKTSNLPASVVTQSLEEARIASNLMSRIGKLEDE